MSLGLSRCCPSIRRLGHRFGDIVLMLSFDSRVRFVFSAGLSKCQCPAWGGGCVCVCVTIVRVPCYLQRASMGDLTRSKCLTNSETHHSLFRHSAYQHAVSQSKHKLLCSKSLPQESLKPISGTKANIKSIIQSRIEPNLGEDIGTTSGSNIDR